MSYPVTPRQRLLGMTLPELMVTAALMSIVLLAATEFLMAGIRYYRNAEFSLDVQRDSLMAMSRFTRDIGETNAQSYYVNSAGPDPVGILLMSPRDSKGSILFGKTGRIIWNSVICYTWDQTKATMTRTQVFLTNTTIPTSFTVPPTVGPTAGSDSPPGFQATTADFATQNPMLVTGAGATPMEPKIIARNVRNFTVNGTGGIIAVTLTCGMLDSATAGRNAFEVTVNTTILCKN